MYPIKITVKCKEFDKGSAQWSLSLTQDECATIMCDTIHRTDTQNISVTAELAAIWTGLQQIRGYQWVEVRCSNSTASVLTGFLYHQPELVGYESAYRHFKHFVNKHDLMINPDRALHPMTQRVMELNPAIRSRLRRASQLVTMGAVWKRYKSGYYCSLLVIQTTRIILSETRVASGSAIVQTRMHPRLHVILACKCVSICWRR